MMKKLAMALLVMFVGIGIFGCYKNSAISNPCGRSYITHISKTVLERSIREVSRVLIEEGFDTTTGQYSKKVYLDHTKEDCQRVYAHIDWQYKHGDKKIEFTILLNLDGSYGCGVDGITGEYDQFDPLISKIYKRLEDIE